MNQASLDLICKRFHIPDAARSSTLAAYRDARLRFETFAALDAPHVPSDPWDVPQVLLARWQVRNFGAPNGEHLALGVCEEMGELAAAESPDDIDDAVGDVCVYACQLATLHRLAWSEICVDWMAVGGVSMRISQEAGVAQGLLAHVALKSAQGIRGLNEPEATRFAVFMALTGVTDVLRQIDLDGDVWSTFKAVAETVMARDWKANAATGGAA